MGLQCRNRTFQKKRSVSGRFSLSNLHRFATKLCERASLNSLRLKNAAFGCEMHLIQSTAIKNNIQLQFYKHPRMPTFVGRLKKCCFDEEVFLSSDYSWLVFFTWGNCFLSTVQSWNENGRPDVGKWFIIPIIGLDDRLLRCTFHSGPTTKASRSR